LISIVIPVLNGGADLERCLEAIDSQRLDDRLEVVVVDSGSTDASVALARARGARVIEIAHSEFNHGATRNLGAAASGGEIIVFTSQDARAADPGWLARLTRPLGDDDRLAGVYGRQIAHPDARPAERFFLDFVYGPTPRRQAAAAAGDLSVETTMFSNVNSAIRRTAWERFRFADDMIMSEDQEWAARVLLAGYELAYVPAAPVIHSHAYTLGSAFRRFFDSGVSSERAYLAGSAPAAAALRRRARRYARDEIRWLRRNRMWARIPSTAGYELTKFAALTLGSHHRLLPTALKRRLSATPAYWDTTEAGTHRRG
jgi:rhamnosyltransferase